MKELRVEKMKKEGDAECRRPRAAPEKKWNDRQIEQKCNVTERVNDPWLAQKLVDNRRLLTVAQPHPHWFAVQPIRRDFSDAGKKIDDADLGAYQPKRPRR